MTPTPPTPRNVSPAPYRSLARTAGRWLLAAAAMLVLAHAAPAHAATPTTSGVATDLRPYWTGALAADTPLDPRSPQLVNSLLNTIARTRSAGHAPWIAINKCAYREYTVPANQPAVRVALSNADKPWRMSLQAAFAQVPIPSHAVPSDCSDAVLVIIQPSTDRMWELWKSRKLADGWHAEWGGATEHFSQSPGSYGPSHWAGAQYNWGTSASSMTLFGGMVHIAEWQAGVIDHAVALSLPQVAAGTWAWPAQRTDGKLTTPDAIPYGARFRLDPNLNVDALNVPNATKVLARAVQKYGFVVREQTGATAGISIPSEAASTTPNPYMQIFGGYPGPIMAAFPWDKLQLVRMDQRSAAGPPLW